MRMRARPLLRFHAVNLMMTVAVGGKKADYIVGVLGVEPRLLPEKQSHAVVIIRERQSVTLGDSLVEFEAVLARPSVYLQEAALLEV